MPIETIIERWFAIGFLVFGLSHLLYPARWAALFLPLRERGTGALLLGLFYLPVGVLVVLVHNIWAWEIPVIVTVTGWAMTLKSVVYLLVPNALSHVMVTERRAVSAFRIAGVVSVVLGALLVYDWLYRG